MALFILYGNLRFPFIQRGGDPSKRDTVVLLLQDMLEVVNRDMMVNESGLVNFMSLNLYCNMLGVWGHFILTALTLFL